MATLTEIQKLEFKATRAQRRFHSLQQLRRAAIALYAVTPVLAAIGGQAINSQFYGIGTGAVIASGIALALAIALTVYLVSDIKIERSSNYGDWYYAQRYTHYRDAAEDTAHALQLARLEYTP